MIDTLRGIVKDSVILNKSALVRYFLISIITTIITLAVTFYFKEIIDEIIPIKSVSNLALLSIIFLVVTFAKTISTILGKFQEILFQKRVDECISITVFLKLLSFNYSFYLDKNPGELNSKTSDIFVIKTYVASLIELIFNNSIKILVFSSVMFAIYPKLYLICISFILLIVVLSFLIMKPLEYRNYEVRQKKQDFETFFLDILYNIELLHGMNLIKKFQQRILKKNDSSIKSLYNLSTIETVINNIITTSIEISQIIIIWVGAYGVIKTNISLGQLVSFYMMMGFLLAPIKQSFMIFSKQKTSKIVLDRINKLLDYNNEIDNRSSFIPKELNSVESIKFNKVSFSHGKKKIIDNIDLHISKNDKILINGKSGEGKSTLIKLLLKLYTEYKGNIEINDIDHKRIKPKQIEKLLSYMPQNCTFFTGTVIENITFFQKQDLDERIDKLIRITKSEFLLDLIYENKIIEENGASISGGQRKKVSLIRTLYKPADVYILDEPTAGLDEYESVMILKEIFECFHDKIFIIVSHKDYLFELFEKVYKVEYGKIKDLMVQI